MRLQPNRSYTSDDVVQTPLKLARQLVAHFNPSGRILEPCKGKGNLLRALKEHVSTVARGQLTVDGKQTTAHGARSTVHRRRASPVAWCEIQQGRDFFAWTEKVDWIVTNPPWSQIRRFLQHAMSVADNVVFLMTINHVWTKARLRDIREAGFGLKGIVLVDMPPTFPQSGFQLGAVHVARGWRGAVQLGELER